MKITARLFATLRDFLPPGSDGYEAELEIEEGASVKTVIGLLRIPAEIRLIIFINSVHADGNTILREGDALSMFPPLAGG
ncbi:MAG TPA: MoaD/ThiS family protein [bacterium]|nr:MoaD/ThiS family protein [bacterium]